MNEWVAKYWLQALFGFVLTGLGIAYKHLSKKIKKQICDGKSLRNGTQALLRNEIIRCYEKYIETKWIPIYAMENVLAMYEAYHALDGNGTITKIVDELKELPSQPIKQ